MERFIVDPREVYGFLPYAKASDTVIDLIRSHAYGIIKDVPLFQIPQEFQNGTPFKYILADGNHRREGHERLDEMLPCKLYESNEIIDIERDDLSPFRHARNQRLFEILLKNFMHREEIKNRLISPTSPYSEEAK